METKSPAASLIAFVQNGATGRLLQELKRDEAVVNSQDDAGRSVMHEAAARGLTEILQLLHEHGANWNLLDAYRQTPLLVACEANHTESIRYLCSLSDVDIRAQDLFQRTALHWAAQNGNLEALNILLTKGADISATTTSGESALHWACASTLIQSAVLRQSLLEALIAHGANTLQRNYSEQRPSDVVVIITEEDISVYAYLSGMATQQEMANDAVHEGAHPMGTSDTSTSSGLSAAAPVPTPARSKPVSTQPAKKLKIKLKK